MKCFLCKAKTLHYIKDNQYPHNWHKINYTHTTIHKFAKESTILKVHVLDSAPAPGNVRDSGKNSSIISAEVTQSESSLVLQYWVSMKPALTTSRTWMCRRHNSGWHVSVWDSVSVLAYRCWWFLFSGRGTRWCALIVEGWLCSASLVNSTPMPFPCRSQPQQTLSHGAQGLTEVWPIQPHVLFVKGHSNQQESGSHCQQ